MKRLAILLAVAVAAAVAADTVKVEQKSAVSPESINVVQTERGLGFTYLSDGVDGFVGLSWHAMTFSERGAINVLGVSDAVNAKSLWAGTFLTYKLYEGNGYSLSFGVGYKGVNIDTGEWAKERSVIYGLQITVPIR
jgi:hypothetical protein